MEYTEKQVEEILSNVWNDRVKGGGWDTKENFVKHFKQVKNCSIPDVRLSFVDWVEENYPTLKNHGDSLTLSELRTAYQQYTNEA